MFQDKKAQTSMEFLLILAFVIVLTFIFTYSINSTSDVNYMIYKIKNKTLQEISKDQSFTTIKKIDYEIQAAEINLFVILDCKDVCPTIDYSSLKNDFLNRTKFENITITAQQ